MKILDAGHQFELDSLDGGEPQVLVFVKREGEKFPFNKGSHPGTNMQEVVRALHSRLVYLNQQKPCWQTQMCITLCELLLYFLEERAAENHGRTLALTTLQTLISGTTCKKCGHIGCEGVCHV